MSCGYHHFISTDELGEIINDPDLVIVDCRFDLKNPEWGRQVFLDNHIPGAQYAHLDEDLSSELTEQTGRHPMPSGAKFRKLLRQLGVGKTSQVVAYDDQGGAYAARLWWMLRYFGHNKAALLSGGYTKWFEEKRPLQTGQPHENESYDAAAYPATENPAMAVSAQDVVENISNQKYLLLDARSSQRYRGEIEPIDPIAGHIPGAINRFHADNLNPDMTIKNKELLRMEFKQLLGVFEPEDVIVYCGSGVTSCLHIAAMEYAGLPGARLYPGSWSEWIRDSNRPISTG